MNTGEKGLIGVMEAAEILGISADTIRRWEKKSLIRAKRNENNYRVFDLSELERCRGKYFGEFSGNNYKVLSSKKKTGYKAIELFSGCGGMALGMENAGINTSLLVELDKDCVRTLKRNRPGWDIVHSDIRKVDFSPYEGAIDIVIGGFPCQAFSYAGLGKGFEDTRGTLFFEFARCITEVKPKIALAENVRGLIQHDDGKTLETIRNSLREIGYDNRYKLLRAQFLDVPQKRERMFIVAIRDGFDAPFVFPKEKDYTISLREALKGCPESEGTKYPQKKLKVMELIPPGGNWRNLPEEIQKSYMGANYFQGGGRTGMARRLSWEEPSLTLTCSPAQKQTERGHPEENRPLTVREYARIQTFPDGWEFEGSTSSAYRQIGNAVPVNLAYHIGRCLIAMLDGNIDTETMEVIAEDDAFHQVGLEYSFSS